MLKKTLLFCLFAQVIWQAFAKQSFQQRADYKIAVTLLPDIRKLQGKMQILYQNNSDDSLPKIYFHLYWNAFQANSDMAHRAQFVDTRRKRMLDIIKLNKDEEAFNRIDKITVNLQDAQVKVFGTIAEVTLPRAILPHSHNQIDLTFTAKIPPLLRRAGYSADSSKTEFSIAQWYPKLVHYDDQGWHPIFYVGREFYGIFGNFSVDIRAPKSYIVAAGAKLNGVSKPDFDTQVWHFSTQNTHDFMWAADRNFHYFSDTIPKYKIRLNFYYKAKDSSEMRAWIDLHDKIMHSYPLMDSIFGAYPYSEYNFIHGGDGGMEYQMGTLIRDANYPTAIHEWFHSWYQGALASDEAHYAWLDEGFTNYATSRIVAQLYPSKAQEHSPIPNISDYNYYYKFLKNRHNREEPMGTLADFYEKDNAYTVGSYIKGSIFLSQLGYIIGDDLRDQILRAYRDKYKFKHPNPDDFTALAEQISGIQLKWYLNFWTATTKTIDYSVKKKGNKIILTREGQMPMPIDLIIYYQNGDKENHYIPVDLMLGEKKQNEYAGSQRILHRAWTWTNPKYDFTLDTRGRKIDKIVLDPSMRMADIRRKNNSL